MKYFELEKSEEEILKDFEDKKLKSVKNSPKEKAAYLGTVSAMLKKGKNINIRLSEHDLLKIKGKAMESGIPYQATSLLWFINIKGITHLTKRFGRGHRPASGDEHGDGTNLN